jgi:hypothetical protein
MKKVEGAGLFQRALAIGSAVLVATVATLGCGVAPEEQEAQAPAQQTAALASYFNDFDGDGVGDELTVTSTGVSIYHPAKGTTKAYAIGNSFKINTVEDLDGTAGSEVVIVVNTGITVVTDRTQNVRTYSITGGASWAISAVTDADGVAGAEIVVAATYGVNVISHRTGTTQYHALIQFYVVGGVADTDGVAGAEIVTAVGTGITVIEPRTNTTRYYPISGSWAINSVKDLDGQAGGEIIVAGSSIFVITDRTRATSTYSIPGYSINGVADTDGLAGGEIIVVTTTGIQVIRHRDGSKTAYSIAGSQFRIYSTAKDTDGVAGVDIIVSTGYYSGSTYLSGIYTIHDPSRTTRYYSFNTSFTIMTACNKDGLAGDELFVSGTTAIYMLTDRLGTTSITSATGC